MRTIKKSEQTSIPGRWKVTLECGHVRWICRAKKPTSRVACGECQLRVNASDREIEGLAIVMHVQSGDPVHWRMKAAGYRDVVLKEAAEALERKIPKAG